MRQACILARYSGQVTYFSPYISYTKLGQIKTTWEGGNTNSNETPAVQTLSWCITDYKFYILQAQ